MKKLLVSLKKELLLLMSDKVGLLLMYLMPLLLVFIITLVQDSAFKLVNENRLELLIINDDKGAMGDSLINRLKLSGNFAIEIDDNLSINRLKKETLDRKKLMSIYIPVNFSKGIQSNSAKISNLMLTEFGVVDSTSQTKNKKALKNAQIDLFFDPILQDNFRLSIMTGINTIISGLENQDMMEQLFRDMGYDKIPDHIRKELVAKQAPINPVPAVEGEGASVPNSSQHNVPAWSLFAMFFMVISLGGNIVKERLSGSFIRLQTIPSAFLLTIWSKIIVYLFVALTQLTIMFMIGIFVFTISVLSAIAAISYSLLIGVYAKTQEQANGFGAISIIIFAAIGGIWVPSFVMPEYMQQLGKISPLHWCIEGYYTLFLKNGAWSELTGSLIFLTLFILGCQFFTYLKLRVQNYI
jgi:ABC-2 type transport system permease protein